jgi:hypothetical protein
VNFLFLLLFVLIYLTRLDSTLWAFTDIYWELWLVFLIIFRLEQFSATHETFSAHRNFCVFYIFNFQSFGPSINLNLCLSLPSNLLYQLQTLTLPQIWKTIIGHKENNYRPQKMTRQGPGHEDNELKSKCMDRMNTIIDNWMMSSISRRQV